MPKQRTDGSRGFSEATEIFLESLQAWLSKSTRKDLQLSPEPPINPSDDGSEIAATLKSPAKQYYLTLVRYRDSYDQTCICVRGRSLASSDLTRVCSSEQLLPLLNASGLPTKTLFSFLHFAATSPLQLSRVFFLKYEIAVQYRFNVDANTSIRFANSEHFYPDRMITFPMFSSEPVVISI